MKICLAGRGDITNKILWSGTPKQLNDQLSTIKNIEVSRIDWSLFKPIFSFYCVVISKFLFTWGTARDPLLNKYAEKRIVSVLNKQAKKDEFILFISDYCIPKEIETKYHFAVYFDSFLKKQFEYTENKKSGLLYFLKFYEKKNIEYLQRVDIIFTQNEWSRQCVLSEYGFEAKKVFNVGFGINVNPFYGDKNYDNELLLIVLRKGTEKYKGLYLLLEAFKYLRVKRPTVKLAVVGTESTVEIEGVSYYYNESRTKTLELFQTSTLYVMPALSEPNGVTYLEALANRTPIVGLNRFAMPEFSGFGEWGFLVENENPIELANVIDVALSDKNRLKEMGIKGQKFVIEKYKWDIVVDKMIQAIRKI
jgi:glycosyltransferase involved in cell wall biosynthesis